MLLKLWRLYPNSWKQIAGFFKNKSAAVLKERYFMLKNIEAETFHEVVDRKRLTSEDGMKLGKMLTVSTRTLSTNLHTEYEYSSRAKASNPSILTISSEELYATHDLRESTNSNDFEDRSLSPIQLHPDSGRQKGTLKKLVNDISA
jgi:hypothetical protein